MDVLQVNRLKVSFKTLDGRVTAVDDISFGLKKGEILGIVGESGSGKSVTSLAVMNLLPKPHGRIDQGEILLDGKNLLSLSEKEMCRVRGDRISMIFQEPMTSLNPVFTVYRQINEVFQIHRKNAGRDNRDKIINILNSLNIPDPEGVLRRYPFELSGGMRQRIMIAIAIACNPDVMIADEPTTALDVTTQAEILLLLKKITEQTDSSIVLITHDLGIIAELAQRVVVMYRGKIVEECTVTEFFDSAAHPYAQGLLCAMPDHFDGRFSSIPGNVPALSEVIAGCPYASRCDQCMQTCAQAMPPVTELSGHHKVSCWLYGGEEQK